MRIYSKETIEDLSGFIQEAAYTLITSDYTCCKYDLDDELAVFVGWSDGYNADVHDGDLHNKKNPSYCANVGIKIRNDFYWCDYDFLNMPIWLDENGKETGEVAKTDCTLKLIDEDYRGLARYLLKEYIAMRKAISKGTLTLDLNSCRA